MQKEKKQKEYSGERGIAKIAMMENGNVRITFQESGTTYNTTKVDLPDFFPFRPDKEIKAMVTWDGDNNKIIYANPVSGDHPVKFVHFNKEDEIPAPIIRNGKNGKFASVDAFFEITKGAWKGAKGVRFLNPDMLKKDDSGNVMLSGYGSHFEAWEEFLEVTGLFKLDIPWSENPLPDIQKLAKQQDKEFIASFLDGKIQALSENFDLEDTEEEKPKTHVLLDE